MPRLPSQNRNLIAPCGTGIILHLILLAGGCADYSFTVNERTVYTPPALFSDYLLPDPALKTCVDQHIAEQRLTGPALLTRLTCSYAGISSLEGLATFTGLRQLGLSHNRISDLAPLEGLHKLEVLRLDQNQIRSAPWLRRLPALTDLDLTGNAQFDCVVTMHPAFSGNVLLPAHCASAGAP